MKQRETRLIAIFLCVAATLVLHLASRTEGFTRDEGYYFDAAENHYAFYAGAVEGIGHGTLEPLGRGAADRWFGYNHEHPPLMKTLFGLSWRLLHRCDCPAQANRHPIYYSHRHATLNLMSEAEAMRFPAHLFGGILVALVFLLGARAFSRLVGLVAAVLALAAPRYFFHAELACFDAPMATTWLLTIYLYWRALDDRRFAVWTGVAFGLALATKHNAFFIPFILAAHYLWVMRHRLRARRLPPFPAAFVYMATVGPLLYLALWPWMWFDTLRLFDRAGHFHLSGRLVEYFEFHLHHVYYNLEYLGRNYNKPPFPKSFPFVMTLLTAPVTTLALALCGALTVALGPAAWRAYLKVNPPPPPKRVGPPPPPVPVWRPGVVGTVDRGLINDGPAEGNWREPAKYADTSPGFLILLNALFPPAIISITGAPIFGATKHWLPAIPFIALLAGIGAEVIYDLVLFALRPDQRRARLALLACFVLACAPATVETMRSHPHALTFYNMLAGGPAGGADLGMNRQYWGYSTRGILPWLNEHARPNANIYWHDTNQPIINMDIREGLLRSDVQNTGLEEPGVKSSTTAMVIHEKHFNKYEYWIWDFYGTARPSYVLTDEGVPIVTVYERPIDKP